MISAINFSIIKVIFQLYSVFHFIHTAFDMSALSYNRQKTILSRHFSRPIQHSFFFCAVLSREYLGKATSYSAYLCEMSNSVHTGTKSPLIQSFFLQILWRVFPPEQLLDISLPPLSFK
jgi:hypothetical protein